MAAMYEANLREALRKRSNSLREEREILWRRGWELSMWERELYMWEFDIRRREEKVEKRERVVSCRESRLETKERYMEEEELWSKFASGMFFLL